LDLSLFLCNLMWPLQFTCIKLVQDRVGALFTVWGPTTIATVMLYPLIRRRRTARAGARRKSDILINLPDRYWSRGELAYRRQQRGDYHAGH